MTDEEWLRTETSAAERHELAVRLGLDPTTATKEGLLRESNRQAAAVLAPDRLTDREWLLIRAPSAAVQELMFRLGLDRKTATVEDVLRESQTQGGTRLAQVRADVQHHPERYRGAVDRPDPITRAREALATPAEHLPDADVDAVFADIAETRRKRQPLTREEMRSERRVVDLIRDVEALVLVGDEITHADAMQESLRASGMPEDVARLIAIRDTRRRTLDRK
jgi:hypothetical protein